MRGRPAIAAIVLIALAVRVGWIVESADAPYHARLVLDAATYHRIALEGDPAAPYWQPPLYPWFLRAVYALGGGPLAARLVQAVLGAVTCGLVVLLARRMGASERAALLGGLGAALCGPLVYFDGDLLPASLAAFGVTAWLLLPAGWASGAALGALTLLLPTLLIPGLVVAVQRRAWLGIVAALAVIAPVTARNWSHEPELVPVSHNGGLNLWLGNNPDWEETVAIRPGMAWTRLARRPLCEAGVTTLAGTSRFYTAEALDHVTGEPAAWLGDVARKAAAVLSVREIGRNRELYDAREESWIVRALLHPEGVPFALLGPLAAAGAAALLRRRGLPFPVGVMVVGVLVVGVVFFPTARYRAPVLPVLIAIAAAGVPHARMRETAIGLGVLGVGLVPVPVAPIPEAETFYEIAYDLDQDGHVAEALPYYRQALARRPDHADTHAALGYALCKLGDTALCVTHLEQAVRLDPGADWAWEGLGIAARDRGDLAAAEAAFTRAVEADGCGKRARSLLAEVLIMRGELARARGQLEEARRVDPGPGPVWERAMGALRRAEGVW